MRPAQALFLGLGIFMALMATKGTEREFPADTALLAFSAASFIALALLDRNRP
jgi:hypothetical protein